MNLVIDQGNSSAKVGVFSHEVLLYTYNFEQLGQKEITLLFEQYPISRSILSSVINTDFKLLDFLSEKSEKFVFLDENTLIPLENLYQTPGSLGKDRIAACVGANYLKPDSNLLVIDAGTAITYDIVNSKNQYIGGNISLGLDMRRKALHSYTQKLPLVEIKEEVPMIGATTENAILAGIVNGLLYEIEGYISVVSFIYPELSVFLTGGCAFYFERKLKSSIFANQNLLLVGLNRILNF